jgi:hypothetical protein
MGHLQRGLRFGLSHSSFTSRNRNCLPRKLSRCGEQAERNGQSTTYVFSTHHVCIKRVLPFNKDAASLALASRFFMGYDPLRSIHVLSELPKHSVGFAEIHRFSCFLRVRP